MKKKMHGIYANHCPDLPFKFTVFILLRIFFFSFLFLLIFNEIMPLSQFVWENFMSLLLLLWQEKGKHAKSKGWKESGLRNNKETTVKCTFLSFPFLTIQVHSTKIHCYKNVFSSLLLSRHCKQNKNVP